MINSASGYECVDVTGLSGFINGNIMPVRDNSGGGAWRAKRYEDLLFLHEAMLEREWAIRADSISLATPKPRFVSTSNFKSCANTTYDKYVVNLPGGNIKGYYIDKYKSPVFNFTQTSETTIKDALASLGYGFSDPEQDILGRELDADDVRLAFYRTKKYVRAVHVLSNAPTVTYTATVTVYRHGEYSNEWTETNASTGAGFPLYEQTVRGTSIAESNSSRRYTFTFSNPPSYRWPKQTVGGVAPQCYWLFLVEVDSHPLGGSHTYNRYLVSKLAGTTSFSSFDVSGMASTAAGLAGVPYSDSPYATPESNNVGVSIYVKDWVAVMDHDFPAEINSLSWNWQPSGS